MAEQGTGTALKPRRKKVAVANNPEYQRLEKELLDLNADLMSNLFAVARVANEMYVKGGKRFLLRFAERTGYPVLKLELFVFTWQIFGSKIGPYKRFRKDISPDFYTRAAGVIHAAALAIIQAAKPYRRIPEIGEITRQGIADAMADIAWRLIQQVNADCTGYMAVRDDVGLSFGYEPESGLFYSATANALTYTAEEISKKEQKMHPMVRPLFREMMKTAVIQAEAAQERITAQAKAPVLELMAGGQGEQEVLDAVQAIRFQLLVEDESVVEDPQALMERLEQFLAEQGIKAQVQLQE